MAAARARRRVFAAGVAAAVFGLLPWATGFAAAASGRTTQRSPGAGSSDILAAGLGRGLRAERGLEVALAARGGADAGMLLSAINGRPDDKARILGAMDGLPKPGKDAVWALTGDWRVKWDSSIAKHHGKQKRLLRNIVPELPNVMVEFFATYNRLYNDKYYWIMSFTIPGTERVDAALVMSGPYKAGKKGGFEVDINSVRFVTADSNSEESREMLVSAGLGKFLKPQKIKSDGMIDVNIPFAVAETSIQVDEVGTTYVLTRSKIPYIMD